MSILQTTIFSPTWWVSSIIGIVLLGLLGMYLKDLLDKGARLAFRSWARRSETSKRRLDEQVQALRAHPQLRENAYREEMRNRMRQSMSLLQMTFLFVVLLTLIVMKTALKGVTTHDPVLDSNWVFKALAYGSMGLMFFSVISGAIAGWRVSSIAERLRLAQEAPADMQPQNPGA